MLNKTRQRQDKASRFIENLDPELFSHHYYLKGLGISSNFNRVFLSLLIFAALLFSSSFMLIQSTLYLLLMDLVVLSLLLSGVFWLFLKRNESILIAKKQPY